MVTMRMMQNNFDEFVGQRRELPDLALTGEEGVLILMSFMVLVLWLWIDRRHKVHGGDRDFLGGWRGLKGTFFLLIPPFL
jgi:hypothetical protein